MDLPEFEQVFRTSSTLGPHTIRSPIRYEVWRGYAVSPAAPQDLLLEAREGQGLGQAAGAVFRAMKEADVDLTRAKFALADAVIAVDLGFEDFLRLLVPFTDWGHHAGYFGDPHLTFRALARQVRTVLDGDLPSLDSLAVGDTARPRLAPDKVAERFWFGLLAARIGTQGAARRRRPAGSSAPRKTPAREEAERLARWLRRVFAGVVPSTVAPIESISVNRVASTTVSRSRITVKADAAARVFDIDATTIGWAVLDTGIDALHPAFRRVDATGTPYTLAFENTTTAWINRTRVSHTFDLVDVRTHLGVSTVEECTSLDVGEKIETQCVVPDNDYVPPTHDHGTHVAGILGASWTHTETGDPQAPWRPARRPILGVCPTIDLWDFRVLGADGQGDEFSILTALNHVLRINQEADRLVIKGVNLSLSITHDVRNYACGWTPVCQACERLVDNGVVVVVAAGNTGFRNKVDPRVSDGTNYLPISITDPGNSERVITVGATHRTHPYRYGVSYFSSRGPTADGRRKPDLLAPGEGIEAPTGSSGRTTLDGTSQATPHVSGAAALLLARYPELVGRPERVKQILCDSASDLGRDRAFQGHGMVDILRALQSV